ncbi:Putative fluoride ion transporter CrcB [Metalysinibacillus saudimassiliensis]|uniref:Fluoride-specific ion channel FluC n=1 Tax=Metalysinibacillus saudimassiliensis TaxID=1461583 RepID=A0A078MGL2_9BACL|nr:Putative fluoride ion transporter CrcB [Metalysinibacillus saudimassiliensis]
MPYLLVGVGGMLGATLRYAVSLIIVSPFATLLVNLIGAFVLAVILTQTKRSLFFGTGVLGSFTTFSTFSYELTQLPLIWATSYVVVTLIGGVLCSALGSQLGARYV